MKAKKTKMKNVLVFEHSVFEDHRGTYEELYNKRDYTETIKNEIGQEIEFLEDDIAISSKHVLRGFHGDNRTWKLVTCLKGRFYIVVLNYDNDAVETDPVGREQGKYIAPSDVPKFINYVFW